MARIRSVKPELRTSLTAAQWSREVRYFFVLLWGYLDDEGKGVDESRLIKADCFPLDDDLDAETIDNWLDLMRASGTVCRYEVGRHRYLHIPEWGEHQKPQHPKKSKIPPCGRQDCGEPYGDLHEDVMRSSDDNDGDSCAQKPDLNADPSIVAGHGVSSDLHENFTTSHESLSGNGVSNTPSPTSVGTEGGGVGEGVLEEHSSETPSSDDLPRQDVERLCTHLADRVKANGSKRPSINKKWRDAARLMIDADGRTEERIHRAIDWCQDSEFWRPNIMSMTKLREKYDTLRLQAQSTNGRTPGKSTSPPDVNPRDEWMYRR